jgi:hypothetical protein
MENQNIILTIVVVVFLYVAWSINSNMSNNLKLMSSTSNQISQPSYEQNTESKQLSHVPVQTVNTNEANKQNMLNDVQNNVQNNSHPSSAYDVYDNEMHQNANYETQAHSDPNDPHEHNPFELYMGKQQYLDDRPRRTPLPNFPQSNPTGNGKGDVLFDRELQNINDIPGGIMVNLNGPSELEPEGVLTALAGEYDGTMSDGIVTTDNILNEQKRSDPNLHNPRISGPDHHKGRNGCGCSSCSTPGKTSEQCVNKMMQQTGSYEHSLKSCNLPGSISDRCHSGRFVG